MLKFFFKLIVFILIFTFQANSQILKSINVEGNKRISEETFKVLGNIQLNKNYSDADLNKLLKNLYDTNFFSDITVKLSDGILKITVIENPIIENIDITGIKSKNLTEKIRDLIKLNERSSFSEETLKKDLMLIENVLKSNGFYFSKITSSLVKNENLNSVILKIDIDQGEAAKIKKIIFVGDKKIKDKKLLEVIASEEDRFWKFISKKVYLNELTINLDKRLLENYYKNLGYYNVKILDSFAQYDNSLNNFKLVYNINAGEKFFFNDLILNLPDEYDSKNFDKVREIFTNLKNEKFSLDNLNEILEEIDRIASSKLYDFIDIKVDEKIFDNKINLTFNVLDSKKFYVEKINLLGNFITLEETIRNKFIVDEGDPLNTLLYNKSIDNIRSLNIFKSVKGEIIEGSNNNLKIININVEEMPTGEISLAAGVGTSGTTIGGGIIEKNFLGKGINLSTNLELSESSIKGSLNYVKPNFAYSENSLFTSLNSTSSDNLSDFGYKTTDLGFSLGTEFEQYENLFFRPELDFSIESLETNSTATNNLKKQEGTYEDFYFNYGLTYDLRNSRFNPSKGNISSFTQELPIISGNNEILNKFIFTQYKTLNENSDMIGKASIYLLASNSLDGSDVRISKRAQIPYSRLRGFEAGKIGPVDNNDYIGGNYVSAINLSTNLPGIFNTVENIDFNYFIDVANVWGVDYDSSIDDSNLIRSSTGIGVNLLTPIGPLSFSFAQPITKKSSDKTETFRFNLGTTF